MCFSLSLSVCCCQISWRTTQNPVLWLFTTSAQRHWVNVLLTCFCCFLRTVSNTVIHLRPDWQQGFNSVQRWEEGRRLNYMLVWIPWNGLLITPEQAWLKFIGGAETHNGRRGNKLLTRTFKTLHKLYISINWRPALLIHQPPTQRTVWHCELCTYGSVYCIFTVVCARTGGCM